MQEGDILLRNGKMILVRDQKTPRYIDRSILCIRTRENQLLPEVLYAYLSLPGIEKTIYASKSRGYQKTPDSGGRIGENETPLFYVGETKRIRDFS